MASAFSSSFSDFTHSLFEEKWWLDLTSPGSWGEAVVRNGDRIVARLPYAVKKGKLGRECISMPLFSMSLGPWVQKADGKYAKALAQEKDLLIALIDQLPKGMDFEQNFHHEVTNWLPFYWRGFKQTTAYTYILKDLENREQLWSGTLDNVRTDVRKAEKMLQLRTDLHLSEFLRLNTLTFSRQGLKPYYSDESLGRLIEGTRAMEKGETYFAVDAENRAHAAAFIVWDERSAYYLVGGSDPELRNSGAMSFLLWNAISGLAGRTREFNFHGSMLEPVERFFRAFGARQTPYFRVFRPVGISRVLQLGKELVRG